MLIDAKTGREISQEQLFGELPLTLSKLARTAKEPYKTAMMMAAGEIVELRETISGTAARLTRMRSKCLEHDVDLSLRRSAQTKS